MFIKMCSLKSIQKDNIGKNMRFNNIFYILRSELGHPFNLPSERRYPTQGNVLHHCPGALGYYILDQKKECLLLAVQHHFQQHLLSHPGTDQDQPCLASEAHSTR
jgi:hypothetical protein